MAVHGRFQIQYFLARGSFSVAEELTPDIVGFILKDVAGATTASTRQLQLLSELAVECFLFSSQKSQTGTPPHRDASRRALSYLHTAAFAAVLDYSHGMGSAPDILKTRVALLKKELDGVTGEGAGLPAISLFVSLSVPQSSTGRSASRTWLRQGGVAKK